MKKMLYEDFKREIRSIAKEKGLKFKEIEKELGLKPNFISTFVHDRLPIIQYDVIPKIAGFLNIELDPRSIPGSKKKTKNEINKMVSLFQTTNLGNVDTKIFLDCTIKVMNHIDSKNIEMTVNEVTSILIGFYKHTIIFGQISLDEFLLKSYTHQ